MAERHLAKVEVASSNLVARSIKKLRHCRSFFDIRYREVILMPMQIVRNDITKMTCDAIVNAAKNSLLGGGGVDGAIHAAAGPGLLEECAALGGCATGEAKITGAYNLPCRYVIHTVGPVWHGGEQHERELLESCYKNSLRLAVENNCESVAFPLISSGVFGYPKEQAMRVAIDTISDFLLEHELLVYIVVYGSTAYTISTKLFSDVQAYIDDHYVAQHSDPGRERRRREAEGYNMPASFMLTHSEPTPDASVSADTAPMPQAAAMPAAAPKASKKPKSIGIQHIKDLLKHVDESFSEMLLRKIDEKGMTDAQCYKKANIDRKLFSKIRSDRLYKPSKSTAIAFAIALELPLGEANELLTKAGYAFSPSDKSDVIIKFFIENGNYNIFDINEVLFAFDQRLLGA